LPGVIISASPLIGSEVPMSSGNLYPYCAVAFGRQFVKQPAPAPLQPVPLCDSPTKFAAPDLPSLPVAASLYHLVRHLAPSLQRPCPQHLAAVPLVGKPFAPPDTFAPIDLPRTA